MALKRELVKQRKRGRRPKLGDVFSLRLSDDRTVFGRVLRTDANSGLGVGNLILIFNTDELSIMLSNKDLQHLLLPPLIVADRLWTVGYALSFGPYPLTPEQEHRSYCMYNLALDQYYDEYYIPITKLSKPVGESGWVTVDGIIWYLNGGRYDHQKRTYPHFLPAFKSLEPRE